MFRLSFAARGEATILYVVKEGKLDALTECGNGEFEQKQCNKEARAWKLPHLMQLMGREYRLFARCFDLALSMRRKHGLLPSTVRQCDSAARCCNLAQLTARCFNLAQTMVRQYGLVLSTTRQHGQRQESTALYHHR